MSAYNRDVNSNVLPLREAGSAADSCVYIVQRSLPVRFLKALLVAARAGAPPWLYRGLYRVGFRAWKGALRLLYGRKVLAAWLRHDRAELEMHRTVHRAMRYSLVGSSGLEATYEAVAELLHSNVEGCLVECGVAEGGCSALMAAVAKDGSNRMTWLFDSFEGLPDPTAMDFVEPNSKATGENIRPLERGSCLGTFERVQEVLFQRFGLSRTQVQLVKGWFQDSLPAYRDRIGPIAMLRIDGDWYESTKCCLENLFDQLVPEGYCIADDYGTFYGCRRAVDEFLQSRNLKVEATSDGRGGFIFRKPAATNPDRNNPVSATSC
jgi:O-methyltransferase